MKKTFALFLGLAVLLQTSSFAAFTTSERSVKDEAIFQNKFIAENFEKDVNAFLELTPSKYKALTGQKLSLKESLALKAAQKAIKKEQKRSGGDIPKGLYIVMAIFGWAWLGMGIMDDWEGKNWWVNLILVFLCGIPGIIHAFIKMKDYYR
ncbi:MAG: YqaE/Pmp3 family membrane protein [Bacteroidetes bacterium]|nr:MAG: YqaE/Pmp3 family membrane protein [Bacteroidota bacterium]